MRSLQRIIAPPFSRASLSPRPFSIFSRPSFPMGRDTKAAGFASADGALPPLSAGDLRTYNRMADQMEGFHNHFRMAWNQLWDACDSSAKRPGGLSARQMIMTGLQFCSQLDFHHSIEEQHIFPVLAKKMPQFRKELDLLKQHRQIHAGLEKLESYLEKCRSGEEDMRREEVKRLMEGFGEVLWKHLDEEVQTLKADNMRKYWTLDEMRRLPM